MRKPGVYGPKPPRVSGSLEKLMIVVVRPWKLFSATTIVASPSGTPLTSYPHLRLILIAVSTASAPVFIGSTVSRRGSSGPRARELGAERLELVVQEGAAGEGDPVQLTAGGLDEHRVGVAEVQGGVRGEAVEVAATVDVGDPAALSLGDHHRQRVVVRRDVRGENLGGDVHTRTVRRRRADGADLGREPGRGGEIPARRQASTGMTCSAKSLTLSSSYAASWKYVIA